MTRLPGSLRAAHLEEQDARLSSIAAFSSFILS